MMRGLIAITLLLVLSVPALAWTDTSFERISERSSYSELERSHTANNYNDRNYNKDYSRSRSFTYSYDYEHEWKDSYSNYRPYLYRPYRYEYSYSYGDSPWRGCSGSKYRMFGC